MTRLKNLQSRNSPWPRFAKGILQSDIKLEHKPWIGGVDMTFTGRHVDDIKPKLGELLGHGLTVERTPPSCALRKRVTVIDATKLFEPQKEAVREAFNAAHQLLELWPQVRSALDYQPVSDRR